jgi:O-antigen/teichoic acid export membrane protein
VFAANPLPLLDIPYQADYAYFGAPALAALALGNVAFAIFAISGAILNGAGLTRQAITVAAVTLAVAVVANALVIPRLDPGRDVLLGAAVATGGSMLFGAGLAGVYLARHLGAFMPALTIVRVVAAAAAAVGVGRVIVATKPLMTMVEACVIGLVFLITLVITGELGKSDLSRVTGVFGRKKGTS